MSVFRGIYHSSLWILNRWWTTALMALGCGAGLAILITITTYSQTAKADVWQPVLTVPQSHFNSNYHYTGMRDPKLLEVGVTDARAAAVAKRDIKKMQRQLRRLRGQDYIDQIEQIYLTAAGIADFYTLVDYGMARSSMDSDDVREERALYVQYTLKFAQLFARATRFQEAKARALYHWYSSAYLFSSNLSWLSKIDQLIASGSLPRSLNRAARIFVAANRLSKNPGSYADRQTLAALSSQLDRVGTFGVNLILARSYAGIDDRGVKKVRASANYSRYLNAVSRADIDLTRHQRLQLFGHLVKIWRSAVGRNGSWNNVPFETRYFQDLGVFDGILERQAIEGMQRGQLTASIKSHSRLSGLYSNQEPEKVFDLRIATMQSMIYNRGGNAANYERSLVILREKHARTQTSIRRQLAVMHRGLVDKELGKADRSMQVESAITMTHRYLTAPVASTDQYILGVKIARLYEKSSQLRKAVDTYLKLAGMVSGQKRVGQLSSALRVQARITRWDTRRADWDDFAARGSVNDRARLASIYRMIGNEANMTDWKIAAHLGLLQLANGDRQSAFSIWHDALQSHPRGYDATRAAGRMLAFYRSAKMWQNLEDLSRLAIAAKLQPHHPGERLVPRALLGLALFEGGKQALNGKQYAVAVKKFEEFVNSYKTDNRRHEAFFQLAYAYRGNGQHQDSVRALYVLVKLYPTSRYYKSALLRGGEWSTPMAQEETTIFFFETFAQNFPSDGKTKPIRRRLVELYKARGLYAEASGHLSKLGSRQALVEQMEIEAKHGAEDDALEIANRVVSSPGVKVDELAKAYAIKARVAQADESLPKLRQIEGQLKRYTDSGAWPVTNVLGEVRFYIAELAAPTQDQEEVFNIGLSDPDKALAKSYRLFLQHYGLYGRVCQNGKSAFCAPAMYRLARGAEQHLEAINEIEINPTLETSVVKKFQANKQAMIARMVSVIQSADQSALALAKQGYTHPTWTQQILWDNSKDWQFERVSGETGNGYLQWQNK